MYVSCGVFICVCVSSVEFSYTLGTHTQPPTSPPHEDESVLGPKEVKVLFTSVHVRLLEDLNRTHRLTRVQSHLHTNRRHNIKSWMFWRQFLLQITVWIPIVGSRGFNSVKNFGTRLHCGTPFVTISGCQKGLVLVLDGFLGDTKNVAKGFRSWNKWLQIIHDSHTVKFLIEMTT